MRGGEKEGVTCFYNGRLGDKKNKEEKKEEKGKKERKDKADEQLGW